MKKELNFIIYKSEVKQFKDECEDRLNQNNFYDFGIIIIIMKITTIYLPKRNSLFSYHIYRYGKYHPFKYVLFCKNQDNKIFPQILKEIHHIQFPNLQELDLRNISIQSIEGIERIDMMNLKKLIICTNAIQIDDNFLITIKSIRKCYNKLQVLDISMRYKQNVGGNYLTNTDAQHIIKMDLSMLENLNIQWINDRQQLQDYRWIMKIPYSPLSQIRIINSICLGLLAKGRIKSSFGSVIKTKYPDSTVYSF